MFGAMPRSIRTGPMAMFVLLLLYSSMYIKSFLHRAAKSHSAEAPAMDIVQMVYPSHNYSVDLVLATVVGDDISWTEKIHNPFAASLVVKQYFADDLSAPYHAAANKGREASMYLTYIVDHYGALPDIVILAHAHEKPWHVEAVLQGSMTYTISHLDLVAVTQRGFANLRTSWQNACPDWIDTTVAFGESVKQEEPWVRTAFLENFEATQLQGAVDGVPRFLNQPCCNQFAVTRETLLAVPLEQYRKHLHWLLNTDMSDYISGRTWEHMFQYLWTQRAVDCPVEWKALCKMYHVCFQNAAYLANYIQLGWEKANLEEKLGFWAEFRNPQEGQKTRERIAEVEQALRLGMEVAMERGRDEKWRLSAMKDIYVD